MQDKLLRRHPPQLFRYFMPHIRFIIDAQFENVRLVGQAIHTICTSVGSSKLAYQIELATVEACNNIIEHAYSNAEQGTITIDLEINNDTLTLCFIDMGVPMPDAKKEKPEFSFDPGNLDLLPEGGMGLYLIDTIMDTTLYRREQNKNILIVTKHLQQSV